MIQQSYSVVLELDCRISKLIQIQPADQDTFVMLAIEKQTTTEAIFHISSQGHTINKYPLQSSTDQFIMLSSRELLLCLIQPNCLTSIDVFSSQHLQIKHEFIQEAIDSIDLFSFYESGLFCLAQYDMYSRRQLRLTYYSHPLKHLQLVYTQQQPELENVMFVSQLNHHSQVGWYIRNYQHLTEEIVIHDLITNNHGSRESRFRRIRLKDCTFVGYSNQSLLNIAKLWSIRSQQYLLLLTPQQTEEQQVVDVLVLDTTSQVVRLPRFVLPTSSSQSAISISFLYEFCVIQTTNLAQPNQNELVRNYFVSHRSEQIMMDTSSLVEECTNFTAPTFHKNMVAKVSFRSDVNTITLQVTKMHRILELYLHLLLEINQNFDDDLLQDALELLT